MNKTIKREIMDLAGQSLTANSPIREGQAVFNAAYQLYPYHADMLRGTIYDPFYDDDRIEKFLNMLVSIINNIKVY